MTRDLRLIIELDGCEPQILGSRQMPDDEPFGVYDLVTWILTVLVRMVGWKAFRDKERDEFEAIVEQLGETA